MSREDVSQTTLANIGKVMRMREANGGHLHHSDCIHNLPPSEQIAVRGKTVGWWERMGIPMPAQITPEQWETEPPVWSEPDA